MRRVRPEQLSANGGVDAVAADQNIALKSSAILRADRYAVVRLIEPGDFGAQVDGARGRGCHGIGQNLVEIRPVEMKVGEPECRLALLAQGAGA